MSSFNVKQPRGGYFLLTPRDVHNIGVFLFLGVVLGYVGFHFIPFLFSPEIVIENPSSENIIVNSAEIFVDGKTKNVNSLTLNGVGLYIDKNGGFQEHMSLLAGMNTISLEAKSIFGRTSKVAKHVIYIKN
mgnify:CR=1 FL=1